ncbi:MAG: hypothetical protein PHV30_11805 [Candidatus Margulisbacteria bacterium]|nr:hypothetical protein [Candidatus Margulisiibacteriota bacterium]
MNFLKKISYLLIFSCCFAFSANAKISGDNKELQIIRGVVVDLSCYINSVANGDMRRVQPENHSQITGTVAVRDNDSGEMYILVKNECSEDLIKNILSFVSEKVEIMGTIDKAGGIRAIFIKHVDEADNNFITDRHKNKV